MPRVATTSPASEDKHLLFLLCPPDPDLLLFSRNHNSYDLSHCLNNAGPLCHLLHSIRSLRLGDSQASVLRHQDGNECQFPSVSGADPARGGGQLT